MVKNPQGKIKPSKTQIDNPRTVEGPDQFFDYLNQERNVGMNELYQLEAQISTTFVAARVANFSDARDPSFGRPAFETVDEGNCFPSADGTSDLGVIGRFIARDRNGLPCAIQVLRQGQEAWEYVSDLLADLHF